MNGRVYDPDLGRFLSADPFIQQPANPQSFNRYSYVGNNPLSFTDPSGFFFKKLLKGIGKVLKGIGRGIGKLIKFVATNQIVQSLRTIGAGIVCGPYCAAASAGLNTAINGGSIGDVFKSAAITFATAQAFGELHELEYGFTKIVAHGVVGGLASEAQGGSFFSGFLSAGVAQAFAPAIDNILPNTGESGIAARTAAAAAVGGLSSVLGGGKFAHGAITGAFSRLFNDERENLRRNLVQQRRAVDYSDCGGGSSCVVSNQGVRNEPDKLNNQLTTDNSGHVSVSGRDSRYDSAIGKSVSNSTGLVIRGVDIRGNTINIPRPDLDHYTERHTDFNVLARVYKDGHLHLTCHSKECVND